MTKDIAESDLDLNPLVYDGLRKGKRKMKVISGAKSVLAIIFMVIMMLVLVACGSDAAGEKVTDTSEASSEIENEDTSVDSSMTDDRDLPMTDNQIRKIEDYIAEEGWESEILLTAKVVYNYLGGGSDVVKFTGFDITNQDTKDLTTYTVYGNLYYEDSYGKSYYTPTQLMYRVRLKTSGSGSEVYLYNLIMDAY